MIPYAVGFVLALCLNFILTPLAKRLAFALGFVDHPDKKLKDHHKPTPYLGGASLFVSYGLSVLAVKLYFFHTIFGVIGILSGGFIVLLLGLADDWMVFSPSVKFFGQAVAAVVLLICSIHIRFITLGWLSALVTVLWVVGVTNAFNLIDIMDGLAGGVSLIAALTFLAIASETLKLNDMILCACLAGALIPFLWQNFFPAKIFMGDAGALLLGFTLASVSIGESYSRFNEVALICPLLILAVPLFDTFLVMGIRLARKTSPFRGSHDHLAHRLCQAGLKPKQAVLTLYASAVVLGLLAFLSIHLPLQLVYLMYAVLGLFVIIFAVWVSSIKMPQTK